MQLFFKTFGYSLITKQTGSTLAKRLRHCTNVKLTFIQCLVLLGNQRNSFTLVDVNLTIIQQDVYAPLPGEPGQFHLWPGRGQGSQSRDFHVCAIEAVNNFLGQVIGNASESKFIQYCEQLFIRGSDFSKMSEFNKSQTFATGAYQRLHEARPRCVVHVVWLWEPEQLNL